MFKTKLHDYGITYKPSFILNFAEYCGNLNSRTNSVYRNITYILVLIVPIERIY